MVGCIKGYRVLGLSKQLREMKNSVCILGFAVVVMVVSNFAKTVKCNSDSFLSASVISLYQGITACWCNHLAWCKVELDFAFWSSTKISTGCKGYSGKQENYYHLIEVFCVLALTRAIIVKYFGNVFHVAMKWPCGHEWECSMIHIVMVILQKYLWYL